MRGLGRLAKREAVDLFCLPENEIHRDEENIIFSIWGVKVVQLGLGALEWSFAWFHFYLE